MKNKTFWAWKFYFFGFILISLGGLASLMIENSPAYTYYHILMKFHHQYIYSYTLSLLSSAMSLICLIPLFLFVFHVKLFGTIVWKFLFILRVVIDVGGHNYEINMLKALSHTELYITLLGIASLAVILIPSYIAGFLYGFKREELFA